MIDDLEVIDPSEGDDSDRTQTASIDSDSPEVTSHPGRRAFLRRAGLLGVGAVTGIALKNLYDETFAPGSGIDAQARPKHKGYTSGDTLDIAGLRIPINGWRLSLRGLDLTPLQGRTLQMVWSANSNSRQNVVLDESIARYNSSLGDYTLRDPIMFPIGGYHTQLDYQLMGSSHGRREAERGSVVIQLRSHGSIFPFASEMPPNDNLNSAFATVKDFFDELPDADPPRTFVHDPVSDVDTYSVIHRTVELDDGYGGDPTPYTTMTSDYFSYPRYRCEGEVELFLSHARYINPNIASILGAAHEGPVVMGPSDPVSSALGNILGNLRGDYGYGSIKNKGFISMLQLGDYVEGYNDGEYVDLTVPDMFAKAVFIAREFPDELAQKVTTLTSEEQALS